MIIRTLSGSLYEIDEDKKRVRRLFGVKNPTPLQKDGDWKSYDTIFPSPIVVGNSMLIVYSESAPGYIQPATHTSPVVEIDPVVN